MQRDIKHVWFFQHPPEQIWDFLTRKELLEQWLMKNDFELVLGHRFQFHTKPRKKMGFDGIIYCEVVDIIPNKRLSYMWKGGPGNGQINLDSFVIWTLIPKDGGTELILEHKGFKGWKNYISYLIMNSGWKIHVKKRLDALLTKIIQS